MVSASIMALQDECGSTDSETTLPMAMDNKVPLDMEVSSTKSVQLRKESQPEDDHTLKVRKPYTITKQRERWTEDEHKKFLEALKLYGRAWRRIEEHVGTKTAVQIRSHAQKYFSKVVRGSNKEDVGSVEPIEIPPPRPKRKPLHPYPRKSSNSVKSGALVLEKPSAPPNVCLPTEANHSPTSVLSAFCSDAPGTTDSTTPDGSQSPVSSVVGGSAGFILSEPPNLSLPKANTLLSSSQVNNGTNQEEKSARKLELFPEDKSFIKEGSVEVSSTQCLKLFGKTVLVTDSCRSTSSTPEICKMQPANDNDGKLAQALPWNFIPINYPQGTLECSWSALPFGTHPSLYCLPLQRERSDATESSLSNSLPWWTHQGVTSFPFVQLHSPIPIKAPFLEDTREMQGREICQDGSSSHSNTESESVEGIRNHEAQSSQLLLGKEEKSLASSRPGETSFLELRASSSERAQGFVPYKRCLADRDARLGVTGEERDEQRIRLCL